MKLFLYKLQRDPQRSVLAKLYEALLLQKYESGYHPNTWTKKEVAAFIIILITELTDPGQWEKRQRQQEEMCWVFF